MGYLCGRKFVGNSHTKAFQALPHHGFGLLITFKCACAEQYP